MAERLDRRGEDDRVMGEVIWLPARQQGKAFATVEAAWFWTMKALIARQDGARLSLNPGGSRVCEPDDVVKEFDRLYRQRKLGLAHARVLRIYGERGTAPDTASPIPAEQHDARLWREAMGRLCDRLRLKGIVA
jgi:hypothetical protein